MPDQSQVLLQTKLNRPPVTRGIIDRPRLFELLSSALERPLTLICAPAGYGKTSLVSSWLEYLAAGRGEGAAPLPSAWLSLDEAESDLDLFLRYFITALRTIFADACDKTLLLLQARQQPPQEVLNTMFFNDLEELPGEAILVLDDYQFIHGKAVHNLLGELVRHWPKPLHLVLISRIEPPLPLPSLRAKGRICEIRTQALRFNESETTTYLNQAQFGFLDQDALRLLEERFEGWPAGLHLAALSLRSASSREGVLSAFSSENADVTGYLMDEVLTRQFPVIHEFLLKTSILDRFCAPLCAAVTGEIDVSWNAQACLEWIGRSELFLVPLDNQREWYRYHHIFQKLLQQRLSAETRPDQVGDMHRKASAWFHEHGLIEEALHHALAAGDLELAARQMSAGLRDVINKEDRQTLERWLSLLPEELIQQRPGLLMIRVWALQFTWRLDLQTQTLKQIEALLDAGAGALMQEDELQILQGQVIIVKAYRAYFSNQPAQVIEYSRQASALLPPAWTFGRGAALLFLGLGMQASGQSLAAERMLLSEYEAYSDKSGIYSLFILEGLCHIYMFAGQLEQVEQTAQLLLQGSQRSGIGLMMSLGEWFLGLVKYTRNELEPAARHFDNIFENRFTAHLSAYRDAGAGLALIHQIKGESAEAYQIVDSISRFDLELGGNEDPRTRSLYARVKLLNGDLEGACHWVDTITTLPPNMPLMWLEQPHVTRVRVLLARGTGADLKLAIQILDTLDEIADRTFNTRAKIELLALRALALEAQGESGPAGEALKQALDLAHLGGFIRIFVDLGQPMQAILRRLAGQGYPVERVDRILAAFSEDEKNRAGSQHQAPSASRPLPGNSPLPEPLTRRELEVLALLRGPASIKEIAQKLHISYATAKDYTIKIYAKLGVNRRWDAVDRAETLGLLPPR
jgi:LuxR family maltose regulon positive regulatory protein